MEKVMPNVGSAAVESVSSTSPKTVKASDKNAFSKLVNKSKSKAQTKVNQKNAGQNNDGEDDGKKVSDNSKQDADDKKVAVKDQQSDKPQTATVQVEVQPVQIQVDKAIAETDVKSSVTESETPDATTVSEVLESDSGQESATVQQKMAFGYFDDWVTLYVCAWKCFCRADRGCGRKNASVRSNDTG